MKKSRTAAFIGATAAVRRAASASCQAVSKRRSRFPNSARGDSAETGAAASAAQATVTSAIAARCIGSAPRRRGCQAFTTTVPATRSWSDCFRGMKRGRM